MRRWWSVYSAIVVLLGAEPADAEWAIKTGPAVTVASRAQLDRLFGSATWPDSGLGALRDPRNPAKLLFVGAAGDGLGSPAVTRGTLADVAADGLAYPVSPVTSVRTGKPIVCGDPGCFSYAGSGHVYKDSGTGNLIQFTHLERAHGGTFYSTLGLVASYDSGYSWQYLGEIVTPRVTYADWAAAIDGNDPAHPSAFFAEIGDGPFAIVNVGGTRYFYVYFAENDDPAGSYHQWIGVARAKVSDVVAAVASQRGVGVWRKYMSGSWSEPGRNGRSSSIEMGVRSSGAVAYPPFEFGFDVKHDPALGRYLLAVVSGSAYGDAASGDHYPRPGLYLAQSSDGLRWSRRSFLAPSYDARGRAIITYPAIVGTEFDPSLPGRAFVITWTQGAFDPSIRAVRKLAVSVRQ